MKLAISPLFTLLFTLSLLLILITFPISVLSASGNLLLSPNHGGDGSAWGKKNCDSCHLLNFIHKNTQNSLRHIVQDKGSVTCAGCHGSNGTNLERPCLICHNPSSLPYASKQSGQKTHNINAHNQLQADTPMSDQACLSCHDASDMNGQFDINIDLTKNGHTSNYQKGSDFCLTCHNMQNAYHSIDKHGTASGSGQSPYAGLKEGYRYSSEVECTDCHAMHGTHNDTLIIANTHHGTSRLSKQQETPINTSKGRVAQLCVACHQMNHILGEGAIDTGNGLSGVHKVAGRCDHCHSHSMPAQPMLEAMALPDSLLMNNNHGGDGSAWGNSQCASCHLLAYIHANTNPQLKNLVKEKGYASCAGCHGDNGTHAQRECLLCHNENNLASVAQQVGDKTHNFSAHGSSTSNLTDSQCITCHYDANMDGDFTANVDLTHFNNQYGIQSDYKHKNDFCLACHNKDHQQVGFTIDTSNYRDPLVAMEDNYHFIDMHGSKKGSGERTYSGLRAGYHYASVVACTDCHAMHGTHNEQLIIDNTHEGLSRLSTQVKDQGLSINTDNGEYAQLCVTCHTMDRLIEDSELDTGNGLNGVHQANGSCVECHRHGMAVQTGL